MPDPKPSALQTAIAGLRVEPEPDLNELIREGYVREATLLRRADRYRAALAQIANAESGVWGQIASAALRDRCACGQRAVCVSVDCPENEGT